MVRSIFAIGTIVVAVLLMQTFWVVRERYSPAKDLALQVENLNRLVERERFRQALLVEQNERFRQEVASLMPEALRDKLGEKEKDYPLRQLASVVSSGRKESVQSLVSNTLIDSGKELFRKGEYARASALFRRLIDNYGYSIHSVEAHFLLSECQYQLGDLEGSTRTIQQMIEVFPESELTGFAMIRLGQIFEARDRYDEAIQVYRTVLSSFPYRSVASQAERSLRGMEP